jgi:hypothetical protein
MSSNNTQSGFIKNLISLRDHYESVLSESERNAGHAREQLAHINALLVEQLVTPQAQLSAEFSTTAATPLALMSSTQNSNGAPAIAPVAKVRPTNFSSISAEVEAFAEDDDYAEHELIDVPELPEPAPTVNREAVKLAKSQTSKPATSASKRPIAQKASKPRSKLKLLPPYDTMSKIDAIAKLMKDHPGEILKTDQIIHHLHGELSTNDLKAERLRVRDVLKRGIKRKLWAKIADQDSTYTLDLKLLKSAAKSTPKSTSSSPLKPAIVEKPSRKIANQSKLQAGSTAKLKSADNLVFRPEFVGKNLMDSVEKVMKANQGKAMNADAVAKVLFGELVGKALTDVKKRLNTIFSKGVQQKRWIRVFNQRGSYMLA